MVRATAAFASSECKKSILKSFPLFLFFKTTDILKAQLCSGYARPEAVCRGPRDAAARGVGRLLDVGAWGHPVFPVGSLIPAGHGLDAIIARRDTTL